jgi:hypothetical protein
MGGRETRLGGLRSCWLSWEADDGTRNDVSRVEGLSLHPDVDGWPCNRVREIEESVFALGR